MVVQEYHLTGAMYPVDAGTKMYRRTQSRADTYHVEAANMEELT